MAKGANYDIKDIKCKITMQESNNEVLRAISVQKTIVPQKTVL